MKTILLFFVGILSLWLQGCTAAKSQHVVVDGLCYSCLNHLNGSPMNYSLDEFEFTGKVIKIKEKHSDNDDGGEDSDVKIWVLSNVTGSEELIPIKHDADCLKVREAIDFSAAYYRVEKIQSNHTIDRVSQRLIEAVNQQAKTDFDAHYIGTRNACFQITNDLGLGYAGLAYVFIENISDVVTVETIIGMPTKTQLNTELEKLLGDFRRTIK